MEFDEITPARMKLFEAITLARIKKLETRVSDLEDIVDEQRKRSRKKK
jgi:hypothetical protein